MAMSQSEIRLLEIKANKYHAVWDALDSVIESWEKMPVPGQDLPTSAIEQWLLVDMLPTIINARKVMGRKEPE